MPAWSASCPAAPATKAVPGVRNGAVWVSNGCRAEFAEARGWGGGGGGWGGGNSNYSITCSSNNNRTQNCDWDERQGRPVLQQQLSGSACQEGRSWGYARGQVGEQRLPGALRYALS